MDDKLKKLIELLDSVEYVPMSEEAQDDYDGEIIPDFKADWSKMTEEAQEQLDEYCCDLFIERGMPKYEAMLELKKNSPYFVFRGDGDSFGWLTGVVYKKLDNGDICHVWTFG